MSALPSPSNVVDFKLPGRKPRIIEKQAEPDKRSLAVIPFRAITDKTLTDGSFRILGLLCSYCNRAGITWVSQKRLAEDMKVSRQAITKHLAKLRDAGYVEITKKGFRGERSNTLRVIFDASMTQEDAIAITSAIEDTRPPELAKRDKDIMDIMANNDLPDLTPEQLRANQKRLEELVGTLVQSKGNFRHHQPQAIGDIMATRKQVHRQPNTVANEEAPHRQPDVVKKEVHRQPHRQPNEVARNTRNKDIDGYIRLFKDNGFNVLSNQIEIELLSECMSVQDATATLEVVAGRYHAEGLHLPSNLAMLVEDVIATHAAIHLEGSQRLS